MGRKRRYGTVIAEKDKRTGEWIQDHPDFERQARIWLETHYYPSKISETLEGMRNRGHKVEGLQVKAVIGQKLKVEIPIDTDIKEYVAAIQACQEALRLPKSSDPLVVYLVIEYGKGRSYEELAHELNEAIEAWASGEKSSLDWADLDAFLRRKGYTPEHYELYDYERVRRIVKYFETGK